MQRLCLQQSRAAALAVCALGVLASAISAQTDTQFTLIPKLVLTGPQDRSHTALLGDVDRDGDLDAFFASGLGPASLYLNDGNGAMRNVSSSHLPGDFMAVGGGAWDDLDGDGDLDIVLASLRLGGAFDGQTRLYLNDGTGHFVDVTATHMPQDSEVYSRVVKLGDIDGDGDADAVIGNYRAQNRVYLNDGNARFHDATASWLPSISDGTYYLILVDVDGDGDLDMPVANSETPEGARLYINLRNAQFVDASWLFLPEPGLQSTGVQAGDLDGDGDPDLVFAAYQSHTRIYLNNGAGVFRDASARMPMRRDQTWRAAAVDVDSDGDLDVITLSYDRNRLFLNDGTARFVGVTPQRFPIHFGRFLSLAAGDVDADGDVDLLLGGAWMTNQIWFNRERQTYPIDAPRTGSTWTFDVWGMPGYAAGDQTVLAFVNTRAQRPKLEIPPFGLLGVHPWGAVFLPPATIAAPGGKVSFQIPIPDAASLRGVPIWTQAIVQQPGVGIRFTNTSVDPIR